MTRLLLTCFYPDYDAEFTLTRHLELMLAESASSPLPNLTSSPSPSSHSLPTDDEAGTMDHLSECSNGQESSGASV